MTGPAEPGQIFLSYSREDRRIMEILRDNLRALGFTVWIDEEHLTVGTPDWWRAIEAAIQSVDAMVVIMSPSAKGSEWVNNEIALAVEYEVRIFPVLVYGDTRSAIPPPLIRAQYADIRGRSDYSIEFRKLVDGLSGYTGHPVSAYHVDEVDEHPHVQVEVSGHVEGSVIVVGRGVGGDVTVTGRDEVTVDGFEEPGPQSPFVDAEREPADRVVRIPWLSEPRAIIIAAVITGLLGVVGTGIASGWFGLADGSAVSQQGTTPTSPTALPTAEDTGAPPTVTPSSQSMDTPTATVTLTPELTRDPPYVLAEQGVNTNNEWRPYTKDVNGVEMALVPAGCFVMGSEEGNDDERPAHEQCFDEPFWIDVYEVTNAQFADFLNQAGNQSEEGTAWLDAGDDDVRIQDNNGTWTPTDSYANHSVIEITWFGAVAFCESRGARLPTEVEWEYAARGPGNLTYPWGNDFEDDYVIWNTSETANVGSKPNGVSWVGALDMSGNVWEWVSSLYKNYPYDVTDGREADGDSDNTSSRVLRGGSWYFSSSYFLRASDRSGVLPASSGNDYGFRCASSF
jgi:formylglycine-generating enzyme required for sulfatase activity